MWWLILAMVSMTDGYIFNEPKFKTEVECIQFVEHYAMDLNSYVNEMYENPMQKINPLICISEKDWNKMNDEMKGLET